MDLNDAIAELRRAREEWPTGAIHNVLTAKTLEPICLAVLSGQLIPLEACNARVAAVVEAALAQAGLAIANLEIGYHDGVSGDWHPYPGPTILSAGCAAIRAITPADAQAALDDDGVRTAIATLKGADNG